MRLLIVEDDADLRELMGANLQAEGHAVDTCDDGIDGLRLMCEGVYDIVLLDRMLPGLDGLSILRQARRQGVTAPVILITALGELAQVIEGLDSGADDYIVKPFAVDELMARIRALRRRPAEMESQSAIEVAGVVLRPEEKILEHGQKRCTLSKREGTLMELLLRNPGKTLARSAIFSYVWGLDAPVEDSNLDNYIHFIRSRLAEVDAPLRVVTQRGVGYRLEETDA